MQIAQINIAKMKWPIDDPRMSGFTDNLEPINALADAASGFVWRLKGDEDNATAIRVFEDEFLIVNMSVWESLEDVFNFIYKTDHKLFIRNKKNWFDNMERIHMALWYINDHEYPKPDEAKIRLEYIQKNGPSPYVFNFREKFNVDEYNAYMNN